MRVRRPKLKSLSKLIRRYFDILPWKDPVEWAEQAVDFSGDLSAERSRLDLTLSPFLVQPLRQWDFRGKIRQVTVVGIEQHGKSLCWIVGLLYSMVYNPRKQSLVVYPSDDLAEQTNATKLKPLMQRIPSLAGQLMLPRTCRLDRYVFSNNISYFTGSGKKLMSKSCAIRIADQVDQWSSEYPGNLADLRKRGRSYTQSMLYEVCSPTVQEGRIWKQFLDGSRGYWTLRCLNCGGLTMKSCQLNNLQFESRQDPETGEWRPVESSIRLVCPACRHQHVQADRRQMNLRGEYVHQLPERLDEHPSYQFGALCSQLPYMSWKRIAEQILRSGRRSDVQEQRTLDNSFKGLPWKRRKILPEAADTLAKKAWGAGTAPRAEDMEMVFTAADTMDDFFRWAVFGWTKDQDLYLLKAGQARYLSAADAPPEEQKLSLDWVMQQEYLGIKPLWGIIDVGGHRARQVGIYIQARNNWLGQKGAALRAENWYLSKNQHRLVIANARYWQATMLHYLTDRPRQQPGGRLFIPPDLDPKYLEQLAALRPDNASKSGNLPENWTSAGNPDHLVDCLRYAYMAIDIALKTFGSERFRLNEARVLKQRAAGNRRPTPKRQEKRGWLS